MHSRTRYFVIRWLQHAVFGLLLLGFSLWRAPAQVGPPPAITVQPLDQTVPTGGTAVFQVVASSSTLMTYKWHYKGLAINGATNSTLVINNVQAANAGSYYVEIKNTSGITVSSPAVLTILALVDLPLNIRSAQMKTKGADFQIEVSGPVLTSYILLFSTDASAWSPLATNFSASGNVVFSDPSTSNRSAGFYRAMIRPFGTILEQNPMGGLPIQVRMDRAGAQSFRHGAAGGSDFSVNKVVLRFSRDFTAPNANLNFSIGTGINSGPLAGSSVSINPSTITNTTAGASFQRYEIIYRIPVGPLAAGTRYYLNLECESPNGKKIYLEGSDTGAYPNGAYYREGDARLEDLRFEIWGQ